MVDDYKLERMKDTLANHSYDNAMRILYTWVRTAHIGLKEFKVLTEVIKKDRIEI